MEVTTWTLPVVRPISRTSAARGGLSGGVSEDSTYYGPSGG